MPPCEGKQQGKGDDFAGVEYRLRMPGYRPHLVIHTTEQGNGKLLDKYGPPRVYVN